MSEQELSDPSVIAKMSPKDYWEWRCSLEEINSAKMTVVITQQKQKLMENEAELLKLRALIYKQSVSAAIANAKKIEEDFQSYRKDLESTLGVSLEDCVVNELNYEVKKL